MKLQYAIQHAKQFAEQTPSLIKAYFAMLDSERKQTLKDAGCITAFEYQGIKNAKRGNK